MGRLTLTRPVKEKRASETKMLLSNLGSSRIVSRSASGPNSQNFSSSLASYCRLLQQHAASVPMHLEGADVSAGCARHGPELDGQQPATFRQVVVRPTKMILVPVPLQANPGSKLVQFSQRLNAVVFRQHMARGAVSPLTIDLKMVYEDQGILLAELGIRLAVYTGDEVAVGAGRSASSVRLLGLDGLEW